MSERWKLPPRVQATAMPTEQEIRIMEVHMFGRELEDHDRPERYRNRQTLPPPATVPCSLSNWEKAPDAGEQAVAFVRAAVAANRGVDLDVLRAFLKEYDAPQPAPSVPADADVAAVLAGLVALYEKSLEPHSWAVCEYNYGARNTSWESDWEDAFTAAQAATGARAAGGEPTFGEEYWRGHSVGRCEEREHYLSSGNAEQDRADLTELIRNGLLEDDGIGAQYQRTDDGLPADLARWVIDAGWSKVAPPTPSVPGVAALLAECARRQAGTGEYAFISCDEIVRLLAPGGVDEEGEG